MRPIGPRNTTETMINVKITRNGQEVDCYGEWREDSNAVVIGEDESGEIFEEVYADGADNWTEAVEILTAWAKRKGYTILELQAV